MVQAIPIAIAAFGAMQQMKAAKAEKKIGEENAALRRRETEISAGRLEDVQRLNVSSAKAKAAASGVRSDVGSQALFIDTLKRKQDQELAELKEAGASQAEIEARIGSAKASAGFGSAFSSLAGAFSSGLSSFSSAN